MHKKKISKVPVVLSYDAMNLEPAWKVIATTGIINADPTTCRVVRWRQRHWSRLVEGVWTCGDGCFGNCLGFRKMQPMF